MKRHQSNREHYGNGFHTLEKICLPNGDHAPVLIWHENVP